MTETEVFVCVCDFSFQFIPHNDGARILLRNFWLQVPSSLLHTWFLVFLLALYFTMKGVETNLKVVLLWLIIKYWFFFYCSDPRNVTLILVIPKKTLRFSFECHLLRWQECISHTIWFWNQGWIFTCNCLGNFWSCISLFIPRQGRDGLKAKKHSNTVYFIITQMLFLSFNLLWRPTEVTSL